MPTDKKLEILLAAKDATERAFKNVSGRLKGINKDLFSLKGALAAVGGSAALGGIGYFIKQNLELADRIGKTADKLGVSTDALQEYRYAAKLSGVETNTLDMAIQRFTRRVGEAAQGKGELKDTLLQYNIAVRDAEGRTRKTEEVLADLADTIRGAESDQERLRIAFKAFDSEGAALVNMLRDGSAGLNKMRQEARELGVVIDEDLIRNSTEANDKLTAMSSILQTQVTSALVAVAPLIIEVADAFRQAAEGLGMFLDKSETGRLRKFREDLIKEMEGIEQTLRRGFVLEDEDIYPLDEQEREELEQHLASLKTQLMQASKELHELTKGSKKAGDGLEDLGDRGSDALDKVRLSAEELAKVQENALKKELELLDKAMSEEEKAITGELKAWNDKYDELGKLQEQVRKEDLERLDKAMAEEGKYIEEGLKNQEERTKEATKAIQTFYDEMLRNIQDATADTFHDIFTGQLDSFDDFLGRMKDLFLRWLAEIAAAAIAKPIILPIVSQILGPGGVLGGGGVGQFLGLGSQAAGLAGVGAGGGAVSATAYDVVGSAGFGGAGSTGGNWLSSILGYGLPGGATLGATLGAAGIGGIGYGALAPILGLPQGKYSNLAAGLGGGLGYMGGTALAGTGLFSFLGAAGGPIGLAAGALLGGILGGLGGAEFPPFQYTMEDINRWVNPARTKAMNIVPVQYKDVPPAFNETGTWYHPIVQQYVEAQRAVATEFNKALDESINQIVRQWVGWPSPYAPGLKEEIKERLQGVSWRYTIDGGRHDAANIGQDVAMYGRGYLNFLTSKLNSIWTDIARYVGDQAAFIPQAQGGLRVPDVLPGGGMVAELHSGERVLSRDETRRYEGGGSGIVFKFYNYGVVTGGDVLSWLNEQIKRANIGRVGEGIQFQNPALKGISS